MILHVPSVEPLCLLFNNGLVCQQECLRCGHLNSTFVVNGKKCLQRVWNQCSKCHAVSFRSRPHDPRAVLPLLKPSAQSRPHTRGPSSRRPSEWTRGSCSWFPPSSWGPRSPCPWKAASHSAKSNGNVGRLGIRESFDIFCVGAMNQHGAI